MSSTTKNEATQPHNELSDIEFVRQFENLHLNPEWFSHEAHLRLGWVYSYIYSLERAENKIRESIKNFDNKYGDGTKYHETISLFMLRLIYAREKESISFTFDQFKERNPDLFEKNKGLLDQYYSYDVLNHQKAQLEYIDPDIQIV